MQTKAKPTPTQIKSNDSLPLLWVDGVSTNRREDGVYFVKFLANLPDGNVEQVRLMVSDDTLRNLINNLCQSSGYYPTAPKLEKTTKKNR